VPTTASPYDAVAYPTHAQSQVHPDRLAAVGWLFGLDPVALEDCRVLEVGCGDGGNLVPLAAALPRCECHGIDYSDEAIARAAAFATRCGLGNVSLRRASVTDADAVRGEFDYILCHGVYSWVAEPAREGILALCARHLSPRGLAVISYNAMPGGFARQAVREMLRWHVRGLASPAEQIEEALALARFLSERLSARDACAQALQAELEAAQAKPGGTFFHDDLADVNRAFFLHEFVADAARLGLRYVADADLTDLAHTALPPEARALLDAMTDDRLEREQYVDFLTARRFRQTVLCRSGQPVAPAPVPGQLERCWFSSPAKPAAPDQVSVQGAVVAFANPGGPRLETDFLAGKLALTRLTEVWPHRLSFAELAQPAAGEGRLAEQAHLDVPPATALCRFLLEAATARIVQCHGFAPRTVVSAGLRPLAFPPARVLAAEGACVVNAFHQMIHLEEPSSRELLRRLDGSRTREDLLAELDVLAASTPPSASDPLPRSAPALDARLAQLGRHGFLVA
jgi:SAM-dependent methyltransferase